MQLFLGVVLVAVVLITACFSYYQVVIRNHINVHTYLGIL